MKLEKLEKLENNIRYVNNFRCRKKSKQIIWEIFQEITYEQLQRIYEQFQRVF